MEKEYITKVGKEVVYMRHYNAGVYYGYPICCVKQFSKEASEGVGPIDMLRIKKFGLKWGYEKEDKNTIYDYIKVRL